MPAKFCVGVGAAWGVAAWGSSSLGGQKFQKSPRAPGSRLCLLPALGEIFRNDLIPVGVGAGPSCAPLFTGVYSKPRKVLYFLMLLPDRGRFPLTPRPSHRALGVIYWLIKPMRETKAKDQPLLLGEGYKMI